MHEMSHMGPRAFNHEQSSDAEAEYDRLRGLAREEAQKRNSCFQRSQEAYSEGDGAMAKELSEQGKAHGRKMAEYNKQASEFIFRENNAEGRVEPDTIDLHGQFVEEAEEILEERIKYARQHGQTHLHVIVGKGNHSANHVQKIKPRVEQVCRELGLQYATEENAGRIYVNLTGGPADMPEAPAHSGYGQSHGQYPGQQHHQQPQEQHQQQQQQQDPVEQMVNAILPRVLRKLEKACCVVM
ncbi:smr family protein [Aspergillus nomiae NRRL 13137]|uniref:Smr family protein n=1 Tax=Aspergillus nomiae NRRL (strain ATCC 15546 / NRRL 13137 / CBS 260.88 / M93) TaxID=1509407 RepID=A0A0L1INN6_ASPN3|nr:smr family protein [Aspergillus nomiae NRRL 13137]KNG81147.1 smr family protein [Aspergillus nomiae NRRL 13137]